MYQACIFDLDGTLADTLESMASVANEMLETFGLKKQPAEKFRYFAGEGADMLVKRCLQESGDVQLAHYEEARALYKKLFAQDPCRKISLYPGIPTLLEGIRAKEIKLAVCSNKPHEAAVKVIHTLFEDEIFDMVLGQKPDIPRKPAPDAPLKIAQSLGVKPCECLYIGDTGTDMQTGAAAEMATVGVLWGFRTKEELKANKAIYLVKEPEEILKILEGEKEL